MVMPAAFSSKQVDCFFILKEKTVVYINIYRIEDTSLEHLEGRN